MKNIQATLLLVLFTFFCDNLQAQCFSEQNFTTPGESTFTLPGTAAQSYLIEIETRGADGGDFLWNGNPQTDGGEGATMKASFLVPGGSDLLVVVGTSGMDAPGSPGGGGGGGGSAVILNNADVLIAAGAGGGGGQGGGGIGEGGQANINSPPIGGAGLGSSGGGGFNAPGGNGPASTGGGAGTLSGEGAGGNGGVTAGSGGAGFGGGGGGSGTVGGGGGGYKGGDGADGSPDLNGKGGDSYVNTLFSGTVIFNTPGANGGGANNNGYVNIKCIPQDAVDISLVEKIDPSCFGEFDGSIEVIATGGLNPYQYSLNGGAFGDSPIFTGLSNGDYTVTVQDDLGGTAQLMITLMSPPELVGEIVNVVDNVCFGASDGSIEVNASGGTSANGMYAYSLNGGSIQSNGLFINLPNGFYVISVFDDNFCTTQVTTSISSPDDLDLILLSKTDVTCFGLNNGSISVEAFGGTGDYMFSIDNGPFGNESIFFDLSGGTHMVTVMDEEECTEELFVFLNEPDEMSFDLMGTNLDCYGDDDGIIKVKDLSGTPPFQFKLNDGEASPDSIFSGLMAGAYTVTVIDSAGCEKMQDIELTAPDSLILTVTVVMEVLCGGDSTGAVMLELQNGVGVITYSVDQTFNFTGLFENLGAGEFMASATDSMGCTTEVPFVIQESATFTLSIGSTSSVDCNGGSNGSVLIEVTGGIEPIEYTINGVDYQDSPFFGGLVGGDYEVQVKDSTGCVNLIDFMIDEPNPLSFNIISPLDVPCFGEMGGVEFSVMGGSPPYFYEASDGNIIELAENEYVIDLGISPGDYVVSIEDSNGCILMDTVSIAQEDSLQIFIIAIEGDSCGTDNTGYLELDASGGVGPHSFSINNGPLTDGMFDSLPAGNFLASVFDSLGCSNSMMISIPQLDGLMLDSLVIRDVSCHGASDGFVEFFISNGSGIITIASIDIIFPDIFVEDLAGGNYYFIAEDEKGCFIEIEVVIDEPDPLTIEVSDADLGEGYITVMANGGTQPYRYSIDEKATTQDSSTFIGLEAGDYTIIVIDGNGCENSVVYTLVGTVESEFLGLKIYPNPSYSNLFIEFEDINSEIEIDIINNTGQVIKKWRSGDLKLNSTAIEIPLGEISQGSHIIKISDQNRVAYRRFINIK